MKAPRNKATTAVYLLLWRDGFVLIALRQNTGYQDGMYQVPAGHIDAGEIPTEAMMREAKEEIGIEIRPEHLRLAHVGFRVKTDTTGDRVDFFFTASSWEGVVRNCEPDKCALLTWVNPDYLPENMTPHVRKAIKSVAEGALLSEFSVADIRRTGAYEIDETASA